MTYEHRMLMLFIGIAMFFAALILFLMSKTFWDIPECIWCTFFAINIGFGISFYFDLKN